MSIIVSYDGGHGTDTPGKRTPVMPDGTVMKENEFNDSVASLFAAEMKRCGIKTVDCAPEGYDVPLATRVQRSNNAKADLHISFHANAFDSKFDKNDPEGVEVFCYPEANSKRFANILIKYLTQGTPQKNRGVKDGSHLYMVNGPKAPSTLIEAAFMDNLKEAQLLRTWAFRKEVAMETAKAVCEYFGVKYVPVDGSSVYTEIPVTVNGVATKAIVVGNNTHLIYSFLRNVGFRENIDFSYEFPTKDTVNFKILGVQIPAVLYKGDSYLQWNKIPTMQEPKRRKDGGWDFLIPKYSPPETPNSELTGTLIKGESIATAQQLLEYARSVNNDIPSNLPDLYLNTGNIYGIKGDVAFCQMLKETAFFQFGGSVKKEQNNFAGLGAVNGGNQGASFSTPDDGVEAHIQHLYAYCSNDALPSGQQTIDPRFGYVTRGSATTWEALNGKWAVPGDGYGESILAIYDKILAVKPKDIIDKMVSRGIINTSEYWRNLKDGKVAFKWEWLEQLLKNVEDKLEGK